MMKKVKLSNISKMCGVFVHLFVLLCLPISTTFAQSEQYPAPAKVAADFHQILDRPKVDPKPSFERVSSDGVIVEQGSIYTEKDERVPILIYKPISTSVKAFPVV